jgi:hypothetical protein
MAGLNPQEPPMPDLQPNPNLVARCGLYCGACKSYLTDRCKGCRENAKATWCKLRKCCAENGFATCASCASYANPKDCKLFNNLISKLFGLIFNSARAACIAQIKRCGIEGHAIIMAENKTPSLRRTNN